MGLLSQKFQKKSDEMSGQISRDVYDVVCLGAGAQCAAASLVLGRTSLRTLVIEKSDQVASTFQNKDFLLK